MTTKPTYEELEQRVEALEKEVAESRRTKHELSVVHDALNSSMSGVIITNLDGRITYVNAAFLRMFEYEDKAAVLGENAAALFATSMLHFSECSNMKTKPPCWVKMRPPYLPQQP
jgi:PAS domain-containing protein